MSPDGVLRCHSPLLLMQTTSLLNGIRMQNVHDAYLAVIIITQLIMLILFCVNNTLHNLYAYVLLARILNYVDT